MNFKLTAILTISGALLCWNAFEASAESGILPAVTNYGLPETGLPFNVVQNDEDNKFVLFINEGILNIKYNKPGELINGEVIIYNLLGQEMIRKRLENSTINQIALPIQSTCYIVKIHYSGNVYTQKIIINS